MSNPFSGSRVTSSNPIVAVSAALRSAENVRSVRLRTSYLTALENAQLVPAIAAPLGDVSGARTLVDRLDGVVLTGGADINPAIYGERPHPNLGQLSDERDKWEVALVHAAKRQKKPILAICRGMQVLNVALGGTLVQDLPSQVPSEINHDPDRPRNARTHLIEITSESRLSRAVGVTRMAVNSIHHQAIGRVADGLRIVATAPDGVIEAVETAADSDWWCVGVQWHPEELVASPEDWARDIFAAFANSLKKH